MPAQWIVCAAVIAADGEIFLGARHMHALKRYRAKHPDGPDPVQGFIDSNEVFHSRNAAFKHATANGQVKRKEGPREYAGNTLFSEDLY